MHDWQSWSYKFEESADEGEPGHRYTTLEPGVHHLYLAGRSHGFGVDFVAIHTMEYETKLEEIVTAPESDK